jgi:uncharacterized protein YoxC
MKTALIVVTLVEVGLLVAVLAVYLIVIARTLRTVSRTLGLITFGVRAIERQTEPLGSVLRDVNDGLERVAGLLDEVTQAQAPGTVGQPTGPETSGGQT